MYFSQFRDWEVQGQNTSISEGFLLCPEWWQLGERTGGQNYSVCEEPSPVVAILTIS